MRLTLLGTAPAMASADQDHIYMVLDGPAGFWLIDCGGSAAHNLLRLGYDPAELRGIILTHAHADHVYGLPVFIQDLWLRGRRNPLPIYGNAPTLERCKALIELFVHDFMLGYVEYRLIEDRPYTQALETPDFKILTTPTVHSFPANALRFEPKHPGRIVVYSADTAPTPNVVELSRGASVLIHEASVLEPVGAEIGHSTAAEAAAIAGEAGVNELWLVHTHPAYHLDGQHLSEARRLFGGKLYVARDGDQLTF